MNKIKNFKCECGGDVLKLDDGYIINAQIYSSS